MKAVRLRQGFWQVFWNGKSIIVKADAKTDAIARVFNAAFLSEEINITATEPQTL